jgi:predicted P-loop ATPase
MLVLESPEGKNKSTAFAVLASEEWFSDDAPLNAAAREVIERIRGRWIVECADLSGMTRGEIEDLKAFLSRREDAAALKYDPETTKRKRSCIFVGTTNRTNYLISDTGNRRFWPVRIEQINIDTLARDRDQLWAEAAYWEAKGESIRLDPALYDEARAEQEARRIVDPWRDSLESVLAEIDGKLPCEDAWKIIDKPRGQRTQHDNNRLGAAMRDLGWERKQIKIGGKKRWGYVRGPLPYGRIELWKEGDSYTALIKGEDIFDG